MQKDTLAIKLNILVSIILRIKECLQPNNEGKIKNVNPNTKKNLVVAKYKACAHYGHASMSNWSVRGIKTMNRIMHIPNNYIPILKYL